MAYRSFVKQSLDRVSLGEKNRNAPEGHKFCNAICYDYLPINNFSSSHVICNNCRNLINMADQKIKNKEMTLDEFVNDPMTVYNKNKLELNVKKMCEICKQDKFVNCFEYNRKVCKSCRALQLSTKSKTALEGYIKDIELLKNNIPELENYLLHIPKDCLILIISHYQIGRKSTDKKSTMVFNSVQYFKRLLNPTICKGGCGSNTVDNFDFCEKCKIHQPKKTSERRQEFIDNLDKIVGELKPMNSETDRDLYNKDELCQIARKFNIIFLQKTKKNELFDMINNVLQKREEKRLIENAKNEIKDKICIIEYKFENLVLNDIAIEARSSDGYINATQLCKAGGKLFGHWFTLQTTKDLIDALSSDIHIPISQLVVVLKGNSSKFSQGSWIHPDLSVQLAQWISPQFAIRVSRWVREIMITGKVNTDIYKSNEELVNLQLALQKEQEEKKMLEIKHKSLLQKRQYHKFQKGSSFYIIKINDYDYKVGYEEVNINNRLQTHRTSIPNLRLIYLVYTPDAYLVEQCMLKRFNSKKIENNHEFLTEINELELTSSVNTFIQYCNLEHKVVDIEEIKKYNES